MKEKSGNYLIYLMVVIPSNVDGYTYDIKSDGQKKAWLVAKGFSQRPGID